MRGDDRSCATPSFALPSPVAWRVDLSLQGKVCVVTGASRGIGLACAEALAAEGARMALCASRSVPSARADLSRRCDVADGEQVRRFFAEVEAILGPTAVVVVNAGSRGSG